ncbi:hypothetical protein CARUB_v10027558mg [Capsella rubella]|uniref:Uncharacterized protein n=1 Tax=Capsella rubella TaxID=81985 RepID=R0EYK7_9BRAS|nr:hypothetical protein CARUB_v10027558mg [Capsella rubella]
MDPVDGYESDGYSSEEPDCSSQPRRITAETSPILAKIVSYVAQDGVDDLRNWLRTGKEGRLAVLSPETLCAVRLDKTFKVCNIKEAIEVLGTIKNVYQVADVAYYMIKSCAGCLKKSEYWNLKGKYSYQTISTIANTLMFHIYNVGPRRWGTYSDTWHIPDFPVCWEHHDALGENNGERCFYCIYYHLSRDILLLS